MPRLADVGALVAGVRAGDRASMARAITLVESKLPAHRHQAHELLTELMPDTGGAVRLGLSGVPGAGKSTFTNAMGTKLIQEQGKKVAVLAVDPSSSVTGGSVLGDRTRMGELTALENSFVRPSPSGNHLGGVARATREAMLIVEAAGYDVVIVETVGVGQSEVAVSGMVDTFLMLQVSGTGDQLQGIKKGILEIADVIAVNKADGNNAGEARVTARDLQIAMKLVSKSSTEQGRVPPVLTCSSVTGEGLDDVWKAVMDHRAWLEETVGLQNFRNRQQVDWMWAQAESTIMDSLHRDPTMRQLSKRLDAEINSGATSALEASEEILQEFAKLVPGFDWAGLSS